MRSDKCKDCGADWIYGISPGSRGWCSAECDLKAEHDIDSVIDELIETLDLDMGDLGW